jgi:hypothetical protein
LLSASVQAPSLVDNALPTLAVPVTVGAAVTMGMSLTPVRLMVSVLGLLRSPSETETVKVSVVLAVSVLIALALGT